MGNLYKRPEDYDLKHLRAGFGVYRRVVRRNRHLPCATNKNIIVGMLRIHWNRKSPELSGLLACVGTHSPTLS